MNKTYQYIFAAALGSLLVCSKPVQAITGSSVPAYQQTQSNWCWATVGQMIYWAYKPGTIQQCNFVAVSRDKENSDWFDCDNLSSSTADPCTSPGTFNSPQSLYTCGGSIENVLDYYGVSSTGYGHAFSTSELTTATSNKRHCIARWGWNSGGGHFVLIYRYSGGNVSFNNPATGSSYTWTYSSFSTSNGSATWTHTLRMDGSAVYGSNYARKSMAANAEGLPEENVSFNFYPNPASGMLNCLLPETGTENRLIVTNMVGQKTFDQTIAAGASALRIDVSGWAKGIYLVQVNDSPARKLVVE